MTFDELHNIFKQSFGMDRLADIARKLEVSPQVVSSWKARDYVPYKYVELTKDLINKENAIIENKKQSNNIDFNEAVNEHSKLGSDIINMIFQYYKYILNNKLVFFSCPVILLSIAFIYIYQIATPIYLSECTVLPISKKGGGQSIQGIAASLGVNLGGGGPGESNMSNSELAPYIISSRRMAFALLDQKFDTKKYGLNRKLINIVNSQPDTNFIWNENHKIKSISKVQELINVQMQRTTPTGPSLMKISVSSIEPKLSRDLVNAVIKTLKEINSGFRSSRVVEKKIFIRDRLVEISSQLTKNEEKLKDFLEANRSFMDSPALIIQNERIIRELEVLKEMYITMKSQYEMVQIEEVEKTTILEVLDRPEIPMGRISPKAKRILIITAILSIIISFTYIYLKEIILKEFKLKKFVLLR